MLQNHTAATYGEKNSLKISFDFSLLNLCDFVPDNVHHKAVYTVLLVMCDTTKQMKSYSLKINIFAVLSIAWLNDNILYAWILSMLIQFDALDFYHDLLPAVLSIWRI